MTRIKTEIIWVVNCLLISGFVSPALALDGFTQADRERLVRGGKFRQLRPSNWIGR